ncbi:MAG: hypothetical protein PHH11_08910 [Methylomonas sp.]|nr:hypothetical protein [Methylomonas sp.]
MNKLPAISLQAAMSLTEWSERTLRRRLADGMLKCAGDCGPYNKTLICFESIAWDICLPLSAEDVDLVARADAGDVEAQTDLALLFFAHDKAKSAMVWLELAAKQGFPDAMQWLGECYLRGKGVVKDQHLAVMWIAKAASLGHSVAKAQIEAMRPRANENKFQVLDKDYNP